MKVLIPATHEPAWTGGQVVLLGDDPSAYWRFWADLWAVGESVIVVEHDIIPTGPAIADLVSCDGEWCAQPYPYFVGLYHGLGCVKFTAALMAAAPGLWVDVAKHSNPAHPSKHWCTLDGFSQGVLTRAGHAMCRHTVQVGHLNPDKPSHGCN